MEEVNASRISTMFTTDSKFEIITQSPCKTNRLANQDSNTSFIK
jgi:hypothetical protein